MWQEALILGLLAVGDEYSTHRNMALNAQLAPHGMHLTELGLSTPLRITFNVTFVFGGGYGLSHLEGKTKWIILGVVTLLRGWVIHHNWQVGNEAKRRLRDLRGP